MSEAFLTIVNMSISASWIVLAVLLLRLLLKRAPKWITVLLWGIAAVRLICPFTIESAISFMPSAETISPQMLVENPEIDTGFRILNDAINPIIQGSTVTVAPEKSINAWKLFVLIFSKVWVIGIAAMLLYTVVSFFKVKRRISTAILLRDNICRSENVVSPFVIGIMKPKIYLPFNMNEQDMEYVIAHEQAHIHRKDHWWKPLGFLILALHWFNPLMWLGYALLCRDIELACDEKVIKELNTEQKADYSQALLTCSVNRRMIAACPLAFGEVGVKERIKSILNYKKPAFWVVAIAVVTILATSVLFLTSPPNNTYEITFHIPAGCENQLVFSEEEIFPKGKYVSFLVGQDIGDTAIQLKGVAGKEENTCDEPVYATPGMPAKMEVEKGAWFQVGIYASNDTAEEQTVHASVKNVEVRPVTNKDLIEETAPLQDIIEVRVPTIDLSADTGADGTAIYYADENMFIFGGWYGLFVYDVTKNQIIRSVDLVPIGCHYTQGDYACKIVVTKDGSRVLLCPVSGDMMYVYSVADNQMWKEPYNPDGYDLYNKHQFSDQVVSDKNCGPYEKDGDVKFYYLVNDTTIGELGYTMGIQSTYHIIFEETNR